MRVLNVMFGAGRGGIEQASLDYAQALTNQGVDVLSILAPGAAIRGAFVSQGLSVQELKNLGAWDWFARRRLAACWRTFDADVAIAHGNRAVSLLTGAPGPVVQVLHNYRLQHLLRADAAIAITPALVARAIDAGMPRAKVLLLSNMLADVPPRQSRPGHMPLVIGTMGRFVRKKGFDVYLRALAMLRDRGVSFRAVLGGAGEEEKSLRKLATDLQLEDHLQWLGWVADKQTFFQSIDLFCLPSLEEPFGIVLLEAFAHGVPVVTADAEGPAFIAHHDETALVCARGSPAALADALGDLLKDASRAGRLAHAAHAEVEARYAMPVVGARLKEWLTSFLRPGRS